MTGASKVLFYITTFIIFIPPRYDINRNLLLLCFLFLNAVFLAVIPICRTLWLLILSTAAAGFSVGILDTATNVQLIAIHGKKVIYKKIDLEGRSVVFAWHPTIAMSISKQEYEQVWANCPDSGCIAMD